MLEIQTLEDMKCARGTLTFLGSPLKACFYLIDGLMVDTGPNSMAQFTVPFFTESRIEQVVLTHFHEDHCGMSAWLHRVKGAQIFIHPKAVEATDSRIKLPWHRRKGWGIPEPFQSEPVPAVIETNNHKFEIIETPGHCENHIVVFERSRGWLFTGDLFVNTSPIQWAPYESAEETLASLNRVMQLDFDVLLCGHGGAKKNGKNLIAQKREYLLGIQDSVRRLRAKGLSAREIDRKLFPKKPPSTYLTLGEWSSYHLVNAMLRTTEKGSLKEIG